MKLFKNIKYEKGRLKYVKVNYFWNKREEFCIFLFWEIEKEEGSIWGIEEWR